MKKQLIFLYTLLFVFLAVIGYACYTFLTIETEPEVPVEYQEYKKFQEDVAVKDDDDSDHLVHLDFDLEGLLNTNPDFDSWLMIPDTYISFPVVRTSDNFYYLKHEFNKNYNIFGCLFFDVESVPGSENRVIHGHNMGNNRQEMFSTLVQFQDQEYADEHKYAYLSSDPKLAADMYQLYAVVNFDLTNNPGFDYAKASFETEADKTDFINYLKERSIYETDFMPEDDLLILSTCNRQYGAYNRLLICLGKIEAKAVLASNEIVPVSSENPA